MKQKQVKAAPKNAKQTNIKKVAPPKKVAAPAKKELEEVVEKQVVAVKKPANKKAAPIQKKVTPPKKVAAPVKEEVVEKKVVAVKKPANKKAAPVQKKVVEVVVEEPEEEDDDVEMEEDDDVEEDEEVGADEDQEEQEESMEEEGDDQDDDEEAEVEQDDDEEAEVEQDEDEEEKDEDDDDEEPTEAPIDEEPTIPSQVKGGEIPATVPLHKIVHVTKLPKKCKQIDIVEAFAKFGAIDQIHLVNTPSGTVANVAFKTPKAAKAALADSNKIKVKDSPVEVTSKKPRKEKKKSEEGAKTKFDVVESRQRTVYVKYLKRDTNEDQVKKHFESCGEIERCKVVIKNNSTFAYVTFTKNEYAEAAKKLHNSVLNDSTIGVYESSPTSAVQIGQRDHKLIVMLRNKQQLKVLEGAKLEKIFSKCGEIDHMEVLCRKNVLAFICFKTEEAVEKALKLNGKTEEGIELEPERYNPTKRKTSIYISNLPRGCTDDDLRNHFSVSGEISGVILRNGYGIIHFHSSESYCNSFLLDESYLKKQMIFVEPLSTRKQILMKAKMAKLLDSKKGDRKRPFQNGTSVFKGKNPKKPKLD